jgi:hypothetical protein
LHEDRTSAGNATAGCLKLEQTKPRKLVGILAAGDLARHSGAIDKGIRFTGLREYMGRY